MNQARCFARTVFVAFFALLTIATEKNADAISYYNIKQLGTLGGAHSVARGINDAGEVVGQAETAEGNHHAVIWDPSGAIQDLGTLGGSLSAAVAINNFGTVAGFSRTTDGKDRAVIWQGNTIIDLGIQAQFSMANAINDFGQVVGEYRQDVNSEQRAFLWDEINGFRDLNLGGAAHAINASGQVVVSPSAIGIADAFLWEAGQKTQIAMGAWAGDINDLGEVVGVDNAGAFAWDSVLGVQYLYAGIPHAINGSSFVVGRTQVSPWSYGYRAIAYSNGQVIDLNNISGGSSMTLLGAFDVNEFGYIVGYGTGSTDFEAFLLTPTNLIPQPIPEPGTIVLLTSGMILLAWSGKKGQAESAGKSRHGSGGESPPHGKG